MAQKVLFITQEIAPYVADTAMSTLGRKMPHSVINEGKEIRTFMPKWGHVNERRNQLHEVIRLSGMNININETDHPLLIKVASIPTAHMQVYFIDNSDYFKGRLMRTDENGEEYADNVERAIFYARGTLETVKKLRWYPDVVVCQGWMSYVIPFYIRTAYREEPAFANCKVVSTLFRDQIVSNPPADLMQAIQFKDANLECMQNSGIDFTKSDALPRLAIKYSDGIMEVAAPKEISEIVAESGCPCVKLTSLDNINEYFNKICSML